MKIAIRQTSVVAAAMLAMTLLSLGCSNYRLGPGLPSGRIFQYSRGPMYFRTENFDGVATGPGQKVGIAEASNIVIPRTQDLASVGWGNLSMEKAAEQGGIKEIDFADYEILSILGVYTRARVIAYGN